jgi:hypothetical protein
MEQIIVPKVTHCDLQKGYVVYSNRPIAFMIKPEMGCVNRGEIKRAVASISLFNTSQDWYQGVTDLATILIGPFETGLVNFDIMISIAIDKMIDKNVQWCLGALWLMFILGIDIKLLKS